MRKYFFFDYFSFTKRERTGVVALLVLIVCLLLLPFAFPLLIKQPLCDYRQFKQDIEQLEAKKGSIEKQTTQPRQSSVIDQPMSTRLFYFDPNTLDENGWRKLGVRDKTIATIGKYIAKGGHFKKPEDIGKIWGLSPAEVSRLLPYVRIPEVMLPLHEYAKTPVQTYEHKIVMVDINTADSATWIALPGIGSKLAGRIMAFRRKLGGFYSVDQVGETYALPDSTFQKIKPRLLSKHLLIRKINLNTATVEELKAHPYLRYYIANTIVQYRNQHGNFTSVEDLQKLLLLQEDIYKKVYPYLTVTD